MTLFVDTSAWYAFLDRSDKSHARAVAILDNDELVLTDHILIETHRLAQHRLGRPVADLFWDSVMQGGATLEPVGLADIATAHQIRTNWTDQDFSLVDCTSFAVMRRLRIRQVATFNNDFAIYRHGNRHQHAFDIKR